MRVIELASAYVVVGVALSFMMWRGRALASPLQIPLFAALWPILVPFHIGGGAGGRSGDNDNDTLLVGIKQRLAKVDGMVQRIDHTLAQPIFDETATRRRLAELALAPSAEVRIAAVEKRLRNIERLRELRQRCQRELDEARELLLQLESQRALVAVAGDVDDGGSPLVADLKARLDALDALTEGGLD